MNIWAAQIMNLMDGKNQRDTKLVGKEEGVDWEELGWEWMLNVIKLQLIVQNSH